MLLLFRWALGREARRLGAIARFGAWPLFLYDVLHVPRTR